MSSDYQDRGRLTGWRGAWLWLRVFPEFSGWAKAVGAVLVFFGFGSAYEAMQRSNSAQGSEETFWFVVAVFGIVLGSSGWGVIKEKPLGYWTAVILLALLL